MCPCDDDDDDGMFFFLWLTIIGVWSLENTLSSKGRMVVYTAS